MMEKKSFLGDDDRSMVLAVIDDGNGKVQFNCNAHSEAAALFNSLDFLCGLICKTDNPGQREALAMTALDMISTRCNVPLKKALSLQFLANLRDEGLTHNPDDDHNGDKEDK